MTSKDESPATERNDFASTAEERRAGLFGELTAFLLENKKWWLLPIILVLLGVMGLVLLGGTAVAPFIYTLF